MGPNQTYKVSHSKGNHKKKKNEETTYRLEENICEICDWQGLNLQNIQIAHTNKKQWKTTNPI